MMNRAVQHNLCFHSSLLGTEKHLFVNEGYEWVLRRPAGSWIYSHRLTNGVDQRSADDIFELEKVPKFFCPPDNFKKSLSGIQEDVNPPWSLIMPTSLWKKWVSKSVDQIRDATKSVEDKYYFSAWNQHSSVFSSLKAMVAPQPQFFGIDLPEVQSFKSTAGRCNRIVYDRFGTRTGRLTVSAGPQIQTLRKDARKFLMSRWEDGILASFDFSAVEARVMSATLTGDVPVEDPYTRLVAVLGQGFDRKMAKQSLLSIMYGSGISGLASSLHVNKEIASKVHDTISSELGVKSLVNKLREESNRTGYIRNHYHRRVDVPDLSDGVLLNSYVQSTAADVALYGFLQIVDRLDAEVGVPVALLHDAIIIDCKKSFVDKLGDTIKVSVPGYGGKFPIKITQFNA